MLLLLAGALIGGGSGLLTYAFLQRRQQSHIPTIIGKFGANGVPSLNRVPFNIRALPMLTPQCISELVDQEMVRSVAEFNKHIAEAVGSTGYGAVKAGPLKACWTYTRGRC